MKQGFGQRSLRLEHTRPLRGEGRFTADINAAVLTGAVVNALSELGVRHLDMPLTPERVWRAITNNTKDQ